MLTGTWMDAPGWKEIKKCRSVGHSIQKCSPGHGWMHLPGKKFKKGGPSAMGFGTAHWDMDGCTCPEKNKKMQVRRPWHSEMPTGTWMDAPGRKEIKKCRSIGHGIWECSLGHGWMHLWKEIKKCRSVGHGIQECSPGHGWMQLGGNKYIIAGPLAMAIRNAHQDTDECTWLERKK